MRPKRSRTGASVASESDLPRLVKPAQRALASGGIARLSDVARRSEAELLALHGMGPNALSTLRAALAALGKKLAREK